MGSVILGKVRSAADRGSINLTLTLFVHNIGMMFYIYILASKPRGTLYIGMTRDIVTRVYQHKMNLVPGFTSRYNVKMLVHVETCDTAYDAITREKELKHWKRIYKIQLIEAHNPLWKDLYQEWFGSLST